MNEIHTSGMLFSPSDLSEDRYSTNKNQRLHHILYKLKVFEENGGVFRGDIETFNASHHYDPKFAQANCISSSCRILGFGKAPYEIGLRKKLVLKNGVWVADINDAPIVQCDKIDLYDTYEVFRDSVDDDEIRRNVKKADLENYDAIVASLYQNKMVYSIRKKDTNEVVNKVRIEYFDYHASVPFKENNNILFSDMTGNIHLNGDILRLNQQQFADQRLSSVYYRPDVYFVPKDKFSGLVIELTDKDKEYSASLDTPWFSAPRS